MLERPFYLVRRKKDEKIGLVFCYVSHSTARAHAAKMRKLLSENGSVDDGEATNGYGAIDHGVDEKKVGFSITGDTIEEAANIPAEEKEQILEAFNAYIEAFNEKDIEGYMNTFRNTRKVLI